MRVNTAMKFKYYLKSTYLFKIIYLPLRNLFFMLKGEHIVRGYILMLHRVGEKETSRLSSNEDMKVSPRKLDDIIVKVQKYFDIIRIEDVPSRMASSCNRPFVVFTMDDGYNDNFHEALPVFKKQKVPFTIFITSDFPDRKATLWWYALEDILLQNEEVTLSNGMSFSVQSYKEKIDAFAKIRPIILSLDQKNIRQEFEILFDRYTIDWDELCERYCLSWSEIEKLKSEPLVTIGAHTQHHYNLIRLDTAEEVREEVVNGIDRLESMVGIKPVVFAYPFGGLAEANKREYDVLSKIEGMRTAVTTVRDVITSDTNHYTLPRFTFEENFDICSILYPFGYYRP